MENNSLDTNYNKEPKENDEGINSIPTENEVLGSLKEKQKNHTSAETTADISKDKGKNVAEKVEGVTISKSHINDIPTRSEYISELDTISEDPLDELVREWERDHKKKLSPRFRKIALLAANINVVKGKGITVQDLVKRGFGKDNAEKLLNKSTKLDLMVPLDTKLGKQYQYVLTNYQCVVDSKAKEKNEEEILPYDISLLLARELSGMKYVYHNIRLETTLNYKEEDYKSIKWHIPSPSNKQKVQTFKLEPKRSCNFTVSPTGTVSISIE
jgi:hypothetical protein